MPDWNSASTKDKLLNEYVRYSVAICWGGAEAGIFTCAVDKEGCEIGSCILMRLHPIGNSICIVSCLVILVSPFPSNDSNEFVSKFG